MVTRPFAIHSRPKSQNGRVAAQAIIISSSIVVTPTLQPIGLMVSNSLSWGVAESRHPVDWLRNARTGRVKASFALLTFGVATA